VVPEGAATPTALLGFVRLAAYLARPGAWGAQSRTLVVDSGTGATAVGLALGAALAGAPWTVHGVMLAGPREYYDAQQRALAAAFCEAYLPGGALCQRAMSELPGLPVAAVLGVRMRGVYCDHEQPAC
jgi:1-aminocyclopropane-1-carboxylate deaminase/D-cysteine desulfhydrase-like pyridoxal-dependent ACC family enzyme